MRFDGEWLECGDGAVRPIFRADVATKSNAWHSFDMLVDTGADRTVLCAGVWRELRLDVTAQSGLLGGIGGIVDSALFLGQLRFTRDDGHPVVFRGEYAACLDDAALDMSVLGRDILDMFALSADKSHDTLSLLHGHHTYSIRQSQVDRGTVP
jgi:Retroviral aspartyl protease